MADTSTHTLIEPLSDSLAQLRASTSSFGEFFQGLCYELDELREQLALRHDDLKILDGNLYQQRSELEQRMQELQGREQQLNDVEQSLRQEQQNLAADTTHNESAELAKSLQQKLAATEAQRAEAATEVASLQQRLAELQNQLDAQQTAIPPTCDDGQEDGELVSRLQDIELERSELEQELENVRSRAAELSESLQRQQGEYSQEKSRWTKQLHELEQRLSDHEAKQRQAVHETPAQNMQPVGATMPMPERESDAVLDTVMAQFEMLQKDMVKRRSTQGA